MNLGSSFAPMKITVARMTLPVWIHLTTMSFCKRSRRPSHSPGKGSLSGSGLLHHFFQSRSACSTDGCRPRKAFSRDPSSVMLSHIRCMIQSGDGFCGCVVRSIMTPPKKRKLNSLSSKFLEDL